MSKDVFSQNAQIYICEISTSLVKIIVLQGGK